MTRSLARRAATACLAAGALVATTCAGPVSALADSTPAAALAPVRDAGAPGAIPGQYVVVLESSGSTVTRASTATTSAARARRAGGRVTRQFGTAIFGYAAQLDAEALAAVRRDPAVAWVEPDRRITVDGSVTTQAGAGWGLDRIDQRAQPLDGLYRYGATGAGVTAYVIDTGILTTHREFGGRASAGFTAISDGRGSTDCDGHGTHVAGTIGGSTYGVAKAVKLVAVRVLDCTGSGTSSGVIAGVDWVTAQHAASSVANLSLGGEVSPALDAAVARSIAAGVTFVAAAGNENADACASSPARLPAAITVGATTPKDARASFSNHGSCLDLFAPGQEITSAGISSATAVATMSGTSMAAPHVAGAAALYLQGRPAATPAAVRDAIVAGATTGLVTGPGAGSPNRLLNSLVPVSGSAAATTKPAVTCTTKDQKLTGTLAEGTSVVLPGGKAYRTTVKGAHVGCLRATGPAPRDLDLFLYRWNGSKWVVVAKSAGPSGTEAVSYTGTAGDYYWLVVDESGSGGYTLRMRRP